MEKGKYDEIKLNVFTKNKEEFIPNNIKEIKDIKEKIKRVTISIGFFGNELNLEEDGLINLKRSAYLKVKNKTNTNNMGIATQIIDILKKNERIWLFNIYNIFDNMFAFSIITLGLPTIALLLLFKFNLFSIQLLKGNAGWIFYLLLLMTYLLYKLFYTTFPSVIIIKNTKQEEPSLLEKIKTYMPNIVSNTVSAVVGGVIVLFLTLIITGKNN